MAVASLIRERLDKARKELLDVSSRNRLVHTPIDRVRAKSVRIVDEITDQVFQLLVRDAKTMSFLPGVQSSADASSAANAGTFSMAQPEDEVVDQNGLPERHTDSRLQTTLASESLQKRLLGIYYDALTFQQEQGVNILYLACGFLEWYESPSSDKARYAPLLLVPVELQRQTVGSRFKVYAREEDITTNLSIQAKLDSEFGVKIPDLPSGDDFTPGRYFKEVTAAISDQQRWRVLPNEMIFGFFSFSKFLMYRDLDPSTWKGEANPEEHPLVVGLIEGGVCSESPFCRDDESIDQYISPADMVHVVDCDSSQAVTVEEVRRGRNLVIQGPPGTGKSQTIANLIAIAVKDGKKVLFVAEKMAALEVVKRRLDNVGLGSMCLELHSNKVNKRLVAQELGRTLSLGQPKATSLAKVVENLTGIRNVLNTYVQAMHRVLEPSELTPYRIIGELVRLQRQGVDLPTFKLDGALNWDPSDYENRLNLLQDTLLQLKQIGKPNEHSWRGVKLPAILPMDRKRIVEQIPSAIKLLEDAILAATRLARQLHIRPTNSINDSLLLIRLAEKLAEAPPMDRRGMASAAWEKRRNEISIMISQGQHLEEIQRQLDGVVAEVAWTTDVSKARRGIATHGRSLFRWFNREYREARSLLAGILAGAAPKPVQEQLNILDALTTGQHSLWELDVQQKTAELGSEAFGSYWKASKSNWAALAAIDNWEKDCRASKTPANFRKIFSAINEVGDPGAVAAQLKSTLNKFLDSALNIIRNLQLDLQVAFESEDLRLIPLPELRSRLAAWQNDPESLPKWINFRARYDKLIAEGLRELADQLFKGVIDADSASNQLRMAYNTELMREVYRECPMLSDFNGDSHGKSIEQFRELDRNRIQLARYEVAISHFRGIPNNGKSSGEVGIIQKEINKKKAHKPLRKLLAEAGHAVQAIKPVFMMSPLSVAQFLEPGVLSFDLLLIDEASQVKPVDAIGAIARAKQIVVVGDDKQLPPTRFFDKILGDDDQSDDEDEFSAGDVESVLGLCCAQGMPSRMLRWHYRSQHHSLIAVSNREFYESRLFVVPSPAIECNDMGLRFHYIERGVFDRGATRGNIVEAQAVAGAVIEHARKCPKLSLGVGAFSVAQRDAILNELELQRRAHPELESYFSTSVEEPFFVKNLENIQGDERDVIFISVGYGRDSSGYIAMSFGPLQNDGGERRLNVLISRAKKRCEVFSSISADDIDLNRARSRGVAAFKTFLTYAQKGILDIAKSTGGEYGSEFEEDVAKALIDLGFQLDGQVGIAGFFIDLAVRDPDMPGRYLLGIECDGATYHSSRSARDRDRLRQQVLEDRGWRIHRIWSTDWVQQPQEQLRRTIAAIEAARMAQREKSSDIVDQPQATAADENISRETPAPSPRSTRTSGVPYEQAQFPILQTSQVHETALVTVVGYVVQIVFIEGPIHRDEIARRLVELWGGQRLSKRSTAAVDEALRFAVNARQLKDDGLFFVHADLTEVRVRSRADVQSSSLHRPEMLPPCEMRCALMDIVRASLGITRDEAIVECARLFGFGLTGAKLQVVINQEVSNLLNSGELVEREGKIYMP